MKRIGLSVMPMFFENRRNLGGERRKLVINEHDAIIGCMATACGPRLETP